jgi:hypothetical protein
MFGAKNPTFDPTAVQTMADALDEAWTLMEESGTVSRFHPQETKLALARRIIELAADGEYDARGLCDALLASVTQPRNSVVRH